MVRRAIVLMYSCPVIWGWDSWTSYIYFLSHRYVVLPSLSWHGGFHNPTTKLLVARGRHMGKGSTCYILLI
ncbi:hypothetical protein PISMIDRAFT_688966, partial [Pisolithus microcarpus 441]